MASHNFTNESTVTIDSKYPAGMTQPAIIKALHNHDLFIRATTPELVSYELVSGDASSLDTPVQYSITDKKPVGKTTYSCAITNCADGIETKVDAKAPVGAMVLEAKWIASSEGLNERVWIDANMVVRTMVKGGINKNHPKAHQNLYEEAGKAAGATATAPAAPTAA